MWASKDMLNITKFVGGKSTSKQMVVCFFGKAGHVVTVSLEQRRTVNSEWYVIFVCLKSSVKFEKQTNEDETLFTMIMRVLTDRLKSAPF